MFSTPFGGQNFYKGRVLEKSPDLGLREKSDEYLTIRRINIPEQSMNLPTLCLLILPG